MKISAWSCLAAMFALSIVGAPALRATEDFSTASGKLSITPIQHASLMIEARGQVLYVDPAQGKYDGRPAADIILITDIHGDHLAPDVINKLKKNGTVIVAPPAVATQKPSEPGSSRPCRCTT